MDRLVVVDDGPLNEETLFRCYTHKGEIERGDTRHQFRLALEIGG